MNEPISSRLRRVEYVHIYLEDIMGVYRVKYISLFIMRSYI